MKKLIALLCSVVFAAGFAMPAHAAGGGAEIPEQHWHHDGPLGTYDKQALQRGLQVYLEVCAACHSMEQLSYRHLSKLGYSEGQVKTIAARYTVMDGPNDEGEMFERPAKPSDRFVSPYPNEKAARYANGGAYPPDMSLLAKARAGGADYLFAILTGYADPGPEFDLRDGQYYNKYFPGDMTPNLKDEFLDEEGHPKEGVEVPHGGTLAMAPPLSDGQVVYSDGTEASVEQAARDVAQFLAWASEPDMEDRKRMGIKVLLYLIVFAGIMYAVKRKVWSDVH